MKYFVTVIQKKAEDSYSNSIFRSKYFEKVKNYYGMGLWNITRVKNAVTHPAKNPWITEAEYKEITGEDYTE